MVDWSSIRHFDRVEFDSPDDEGSGDKMDADFIRMLDGVREIAGIPFKVNSGYRTKSHNKKIKGSPNSSHMKGLAADIHCTDSVNRLLILGAAITVGIFRIGIGKTFIHLDIDEDKVNAIWLYGA